MILLFCLLCPAAWAEEAGDRASTGDKAPPGGSAQALEVSPQGQEARPGEKARLTIAPQTVVITAGFQDGAVTLEPTKTVIDLTQFEASGSVDRVEDVLKHMSGIDVIQATGGADPQQMIMMRGFDDSRFQVAINGRPITAPTAGSDTFVDWSSLTTGDIERIEVIRGSASARYENSVGGIINIVTKKGAGKAPRGRGRPPT
jgi:iron complex outermembrane receptor protein